MGNIADNKNPKKKNQSKINTERIANGLNRDSCARAQPKLE